MSEAASEIIQQRIQEMAAINSSANQDLQAHISQMRERLEATQGIYMGSPSALPTDVGADRDYLYKRAQIQSSAWASEVIAAAALDETFLQEVGERARSILIENDQYPGTQNRKEPTPSTQ